MPELSDTAFVSLSAADSSAVLRLNAEEVQWTSELDADGLAELMRHAFVMWKVVVGPEIAGFIIALADDCAYEGDNLNWFQSRYSNFVYVDRIVVNSKYAGQGLGKQLYEQLIAYSKARGRDRVVCEYNIVPMNEPSRIFHSRFGFSEVGQRVLAEGNKTVSMQALALS